MDPKIIATIGPVSGEYAMLKKLIKAGVNIVRVNFSHATFEQWEIVCTNIKKIEKELEVDVQMMMDLQGPRIRVGNMGEGMKISKGTEYILVYGKTSTAQNEIPVDYAKLSQEVKPGELIYIANKAIELEVVKVVGKKIHAIAKTDGILLSRKGLNLPDTDLLLPIMDKKDIADAQFGVKNGADYICLSFVKDASDVVKARKIIKNGTKIIAKIERRLALKNIDGIIKESDGIMIARGDLGIEVPIEEIAIIQKELVRHAHQYGKPAIVATEMLASMVSKPNPTRAEAADVANAVFDGADAVMLSDETASGNYPVESVEMMEKIVKKVDEYFNNTNYLN